MIPIYSLPSSAQTSKNSNFTDNSIFWMFSVNKEKFEFISPNCKNITGYEANEFYLNPRLWLNMIHESKLDFSFSNKILTNDHLILETIYTIKDKTGNIKIVKDKIIPIIEQSGELTHVTGVTTELMELPTKIIEKLDFPFCIITYKRKDYLIDYYNEIFEKKFNGFNNNGNKIDNNIKNRLEKNFADALLNSLEHLKISNEEKTKFVYQTKVDEDVTYYQFEILKSVTNENEIIFICYGFDVTELKINEIRLQKLNQDKNRLLSIVSHDLKGPFNSILNLIEMINSDLDINEEQKREFLQFIYDSAKQQLELIHDMLDWSKIDSGLLEFYPTYVNLYQVIEKILLSYKGQIYQKEIKVELQFDKNLLVFFDKNYLKVVLSNLISNAIKFSHKQGKIIISAEESKEFSKIKIQDFGIGMSDRYINLILNSSQNISKLGTLGEKGTGLGLKFCYDIITSHFGKFTIDSSSKKGTTIELLLKKPAHEIIYFDNKLNELHSLACKLLPNKMIYFTEDILRLNSLLSDSKIDLIILNIQILKDLHQALLETIFSNINRNTKIVGFGRLKDEDLEKLKQFIPFEEIIYADNLDRKKILTTINSYLTSS